MAAEAGDTEAAADLSSVKAGGVPSSFASMPALMDSAVLLGGIAAAAAPATKALHQLEASGQLDTAAPTPTASGVLDDWQVVTMAEIRTALAGTFKDAPGSPCSTDSGNAESPSAVSPGKGRKERTRRGRPRSGDRNSPPASLADGADGDVEAPPKGPAKAAAGRALPGRKPTGICAWNPFAGLGPKLMGPRQKAGAHILDLAAAPRAAAAAADATKAALPRDVAAIVASIEGSGSIATAADGGAAKGVSGTAGGQVKLSPAGLADSTPDIDTAAADAGVKSLAAGAGSDEAAPTPDYDTAKECSGGAGKGASQGWSKLGAKAENAGAADTGSKPPADGETIAMSSVDKVALPAVASDYSLPKGKAKKGKKKRAKK